MLGLGRSTQNIRNIYLASYGCDSQMPSILAMNQPCNSHNEDTSETPEMAEVLSTSNSQRSEEYKLTRILTMNMWPNYIQ